MSERSIARRTARVTVSALALSTALGIAGCAPRAEEAPAPAAPAATLDFPAGARVEVQRFGKWFPATVLVSNAGKWKIHYDGFGAEWDELVGTDRIRAVMPTFPVGEKVLVQMANRVALAEVAAQVDPLHWRVHYDGYGPEVGEVVGPDRLRRPYTGVVTHPVGEPVGVDINGHVFSGKIIALASADHMLVRFPTFGPDYDQEIGPERLRPVPAAVEAPAAPAPAPALAAAPAPPAPGPAAHPGPATAPVPGSKPAGTIAAGEPVFVAQRLGWLPATVHASGGPGVWKIHYDGSASGDEDVPQDRLMVAPQPLKGHYQPGQAVFIEWHGIYVGGKVLKEPDKGQYKVRFDGQGPAADEVLPATRLRPR